MMFSPGSGNVTGKGGGSKGPGKNEGSPTQMFRFRQAHLALEGNKVSKRKGLWQVRKVLEVCLGLVLETVSMVPLAMVSDKVLVSLDPQ